MRFFNDSIEGNQRSGLGNGMQLPDEVGLKELSRWADPRLSLFIVHVHYHDVETLGLLSKNKLVSVGNLTPENAVRMEAKEVLSDSDDVGADVHGYNLTESLAKVVSDEHGQNSCSCAQNKDI